MYVLLRNYNTRGCSVVRTSVVTAAADTPRDINIRSENVYRITSPLGRSSTLITWIYKRTDRHKRVWSHCKSLGIKPDSNLISFFLIRSTS